MDLWIRSQSREILTPIQEPLSIREYIKYKTIKERQIKENFRNEFIEIYVDKEVVDEYISCEIIYRDWCLGSYSTKERALEVLDEIQKIFYNNQKFINNVVVYEMPKE